MPVEVGRAGGQVVCECGAAVDVPTLRRLRQLPAESSEPQARGMAWRPRHGVMAVFLILAAGLASVCLWAQLTKPTLPTFDSAGMHQLIGRQLEKLTPAEAWNWWTRNGSQVEAGFTAAEFKLPPHLDDELRRKQFLVKAMLVLCGLAVIGALGAALWPTGKPRGQ